MKDPKAKETLIYLLDDKRNRLQLFEKMIEQEDPEALDGSKEDILERKGNIGKN